MTLVIALVVLWSVWLLWSGRANSPRRRREQARWDYIIDQARRTERDD